MIPNPGSVVYGTLIVGALLAAESARRESYADTILAVVLALVVYWLAHAYAEFTEHRLEHKHELTLAGLTRVLAHELTILVGAAIPLVALVVGRIVGAGLDSAVTAAVWTSAAVVVLVEIIAAVRAELKGWELVGQAAAGTVFGVLVIGLKVVLH